MYRLPLDWLEQWSTGQADLVLVNSKFTAGVFRQTFPRLAARRPDPQVLYPAVQVPPPNTRSPSRRWEELRGGLSDELQRFLSNGICFLSINRFERKKGIPLALRALAQLRGLMPQHEVRLVVAGGYDKRLRENVEHLAELELEASELGISGRVAFLPSFREPERVALLEACTGVLYTPENEHFGIVPLEAMAAGRPVIACASGGPLESIAGDQTGFLCDPTPAAFAQAMARLLEPGTAARMGSAAYEHVRQGFSREVFGDKLEGYIRSILQ